MDYAQTDGEDKSLTVLRLPRDADWRCHSGGDPLVLKKKREVYTQGSIRGTKPYQGRSVL
jgi:hypothetical protein